MGVFRRDLEIRFPNGDYQTITGENIVSESMTITKSICDGNLKLGGCIATQFDLQLIGIRPDEIQGKKIQAVFLEYSDEHFEVLYPRDDLYPSDTLIPDGRLAYNCTEKIVFTGYIDTAKRQKNREYVTIIAYDELYMIGKTNVYDWFYNFAMYSSNPYIMSIIDSLFGSQIGYDEDARKEGMQWLLRWQTSGGNNNFTKPISLSFQRVKEYKGNITASEILRSANELMGLFGYMTEDGKYTTKSIVNNLTPIVINNWIDLDFEEYITAQIDIVSFSYNGGNNKISYGRTSSLKSTYVSDDNILAYCCGQEDKISQLVNNLTNNGKLAYKEYRYRPFRLSTAEALLPHSKIELGSKIKIRTGYGDDDVRFVNGFVFQIKIKGIQSLMYEFSAEGDQVLNGYDSIDERI